MSTKDFLEKKMIVLNKVIALVEQQKGNSPISLTYLLENTDLNEEEVKQIVELLEKERNIALSYPSPRVTLLQPLSTGYQKVAAWEVQKAAERPKKKLLSAEKIISGSLLVALLGLLWWWQGLSPSTTEIDPFSASVPMLLSIGKIIGGSLLAALLGLFLWWLGLSPSTTKIVPLSASVPIRLYHTEMWPPNVLFSGGLYHFPNAPESLEPVFTKDAEETQELIEKFDFSYDPVTLDGFVKIILDVENVAPSYQVNITSLQVAVIRQPAKNSENLYLVPPALGGGTAWEYELLLSPQSQVRDVDGVVYYETALNPDNPSIDYIYVKSGERETLEISIQLDEPGIFEIIPIIHYSYRDKKASVEADRYTITYPDKYRVWVVNYMFCEGKICQDGSSVFKTNGVIVNTQSNEVMAEIPFTVQERKSCFSEPKWIVFEAPFVTFGYFRRLYIVDTNGENLREIDSSDIANRTMNYRYLAWRDDGLLVFGKTYIPHSTSHSIYDEITEYFVLDPVSLEMEKIEDIDISRVIYDNSNRSEHADYWEPSPSADEQWLISGGEKLSIKRADGTCSQDLLGAPFTGIINWLLQP